MLDDTRAADFTVAVMNNTTRRKRDEELMSMLLEEDVPGVDDVLELFESFLKIFQSHGTSFIGILYLNEQSPFYIFL